MQLVLPVFEVGGVEREVDGLTVVVVEAETYALRFGDGGEAGTGQLDEELVFVFPAGIVCGACGRLFDGGLHLPWVAVGVEDGLGAQLALVVAVVPDGEDSALEFA